jgi:beta-glucosidase
MKNRTYRYFTGTPLYTFGYGLSYTRFSYDDASANAVRSADGTVHVSAKVTNAGESGGRRGGSTVH